MGNLWIFAVLGLTAGGAYAITAVGIVTIYRGSGVLNFAQCAIGMVGAYGFYELRYGGLATLPTGVAFAAGVLISAALSIVMYLLVMRPLLQAAELAKVVATIGVLLVVQGLATIHYGTFPTLVSAFLPAGGLRLGSATLAYSTLIMLAALAVVTLLLLALFRFTRLGLAATALQERPDAAKVLGISPTPTGVVVWGLGGALAAIAAILLLPVTQLSPAQATTLLFPAFAAGLFGRFRNYGTAIAAGLVIGIFDSILVGYQWPTYLVNAIPFAIIIAALMLGGTSIPGRGLVAARLPKLGDGRPRPLVIVAAVALTIGTVAWSTQGWSIAVEASVIAGLIGLSVVVATGYAGQVTLLPFAIAGISALAAVHMADSWHIPFVVALVVSILVGSIVGALSGLPSIRVRGLDLAVVTLGLALVVETSIFAIPALTNDNQGVTVPSPALFGLAIGPTTHAKSYAAVGVIVFTLAALAVVNLRRSRAGRRLVSVRANERGAAALGISVPGAKIGAFAFSGALAGLAGGLLLYQSSLLDLSNGFSAFLSMTALCFAIVGGVGLVAGGLFAGILGAGGLGAYWFRNYSTVNEWLLVLSGVFVIYVMLTHADGEADRFSQLVRWLTRRAEPSLGKLRERLPLIAGRRAAARTQTITSAVSEVPMPSRPAGAAGDGGTPSLRVQNLTVKYGPVTAVNGVGLTVTQGRILGVVGPNGAGKTSLIDALTGFCPITSGSVFLEGADITRWRVTRRARAGLGRTFQNLELFVELTVRENLLAAADRRDLWAYFWNVVRPGSRSLSDEAELAARILGIEDFLDRPTRDLPTGTQRLVAIARAVAARPRVLCLDEPSAGLNEQERHSFVTALQTLVQAFELGILVVEHNVDVVSELCHEVLVLDFGQVAASGPTTEVLQSEVVRAAYLGASGHMGDPQSGVTAVTAGEQAS
jgi:ABC-type branched-subunit amino acid transport system ATPase component/branched-subunit amino acid ABC-type transport system permease component